jgi:hypothetical protein
MSLALTTTHENGIFGGVSERFLRVLATMYFQRRYGSGVQNFSDVPGKPNGSFSYPAASRNFLFRFYSRAFSW